MPSFGRSGRTGCKSTPATAKYRTYPEEMNASKRKKKHYHKWDCMSKAFSHNVQNHPFCYFYNLAFVNELYEPIKCRLSGKIYIFTYDYKCCFVNLPGYFLSSSSVLFLLPDNSD